MACNIEDISTKLLISLGITGVAEFTSGLALALVLSNKKIGKSLRVILISFFLSNIIGSIVIIDDVIFSLCDKETKQETKSSKARYISVSMLLALLHFILLEVHEFSLMQSDRKHHAKEYLGLLVCAWLVAAMPGFMHIFYDDTTEYLLISIYIALLAVIIAFYTFLVKKVAWKQKAYEKYNQFFLEQNIHGHKKDEKDWKMTFILATMVYYAVCSTPWQINEIAIKGAEPRTLYNSISYYSHQFYALSFILSSLHYIILHMRQCIRRNNWHRPSYRLRRAYSVRVHNH